MLVRELIEALSRLPPENVVDVDNLEGETAAKAISLRFPESWREDARKTVLYVQEYQGLSMLYLVKPGS